MAVRFDAATDGYSSTVGLPTGTAWTFLAWAYLSADRNDYSPIVEIHSAPGGNAVWLETGADGTTLSIFTNAGSVGSFAMNVGTWYRVAMVVNGTTATLHAGAAGAALTSASGSPGALPSSFARIYLGIEEYGAWLNGRLAAPKLFTSALTVGECENELAQYEPQRTVDLRRWHPFVVAETVDYSGNGFNLTAGSTATTTEDGPPIRWGRTRGTRVSVATVPSTSPVSPTVLTQAALVRAHYW